MFYIPRLSRNYFLPKPEPGSVRAQVNEDEITKNSGHIMAKLLVVKTELKLMYHFRCFPLVLNRFILIGSQTEKTTINPLLKVEDS